MIVQFRSDAVHVRVPATSANLGPGFDALGLALAIYDEVSAEVASSGLTIEVSGEGAGEVVTDERHLVVQAMRATFEVLGAQPPGLRLMSVNSIPHGRGLGSSAAAIVAGVLLARGLVIDCDLSADQVLALAAAVEGHPDNVAACLLGGLTVAWTERGGSARALRLEPRAVVPVVMIPAVQSATKAARQALPLTVPHVDAAFNAARSALLVAALTSGAVASLWDATQDRLHQDFRADGMPASAQLLAILREAGIAAVISGAGPSVLALSRSSAEVEAVRALVPAGWRIETPEIDLIGAQIR
jgi:homoserine kinase